MIEREEVEPHLKGPGPRQGRLEGNQAKRDEAPVKDLMDNWMEKEGYDPELRRRVLAVDTTELRRRIDEGRDISDLIDPLFQPPSSK